MSRKNKNALQNQKRKNTTFYDNSSDYGGVERQQRPKINWTKHDLAHIRPLTENQDHMFKLWFSGHHICAHGTAGTGKSFLSTYLALSELLNPNNNIDRIIIIRSAVSGREIGHLPGTLEEKMMAFELPYIDIFAELMGRESTYDNMKKRGIIDFMSTSFVRGLTWDNAVVIVDEFQNMTWFEVDSVLTRIGENTRVLICGDDRYQCDLKREKTCARSLINTISKIPDFGLVNFTRDDCVRSKFVKDWIVAREDANI